MCDALALPESLVISKNEYFVLPDRASSRASELIAAESCLGETVGIFKEIRRVQRAVAKKLIRTAVNLVGARAADRIDDAAGGEAVL